MEMNMVAPAFHQHDTVARPERQNDVSFLSKVTTELSRSYDLILSNSPLGTVLDSVVLSASIEYDQSSRILVLAKDTASATGWTVNDGAREERFLPLILPSAAQGPVNQILKGEECLFFSDMLATGDNQEFRLRAAALGFRSAVLVPLCGRNSSQVEGVVAIYFSQQSGSKDQCIDAARHLANLLSTVLGVRSLTSKVGRAEDQLTALASAIPGVVYQRRVQTNGEIRYTYISESAYDLFGVSAETILANPEALFQHYRPDYRKSFREKLLKASAEMQIWDVEATINRPDGTIRYTHAIARPTKEEDGSVLWTGVILDATRIKEAELAAKEAAITTRNSIVESLSQGLLMFDRDDKLTICNSHFLKLYPALASYVTPGTSYNDIIHAELDAKINPHAPGLNTRDELVDRLVRHGETHLVYEREMANDRHILVTEYKTPEKETVVIYADISELKRRERKIKHLAHHDSLTGLPNRVVFREKLEEATSKAAQEKSTAAVLCLDLDRFKHVNDTLGHHVGDVLLQEVARRLQSVVRREDVACRLGGDEFAVIMPNVKSVDLPTSLAWRILDALSRPYTINDQTIISGTTIGIAMSAKGEVAPDDVLKNSDLALYRAKSEGRGTFRFFEADMDAKAQARRLMEIELRAALALDQLEVHYQPLIDIYTAQLIGVEALIRWNHPKQGPIAPADFIPLAEETGLINQIGRFVLERACNDSALWPDDIRIAVNISPTQFKDNDFVDYVKKTVKKSKLQPKRLELEITESMLLRNTDTNLAILHELKAFGIRISMDDFGTGYSSLGNLRSFPFDKIKIDKSFIADLNKTPDAAAIIRAVLSLGRSLGMTTTAEGVETRDQLAYLRAEGCIEVQGHYYAKAMTLKEMQKILIEKPGRVFLPAIPG
jgi:diguanylate cyclase (GGDEF)-like protein/PAS domain S-box-containing protein